MAARSHPPPFLCARSSPAPSLPSPRLRCLLLLLLCSLLLPSAVLSEILGRQEMCTLRKQAAYSYIIVGGGTAGSVVASALSKQRGVSVLVLEAGDESALSASSPLDDFYRLAHAPHTEAESSTSWGYRSEPHAHLRGRTFAVPAGKSAGGSSIHDDGLYLRASPQDFEDWARLGVTGWDYDTLLPHFKNIEGSDEESEFHGTLGKVNPYQVELSPLGEAVIAAAAANGFPRNDDFNAESHVGAGPAWLNVNVDNTRNTSYSSYLQALAHDPASRVDLVLNAQAQRILFEDKRAVGVEYLNADDKVITVLAIHEVILCAGPIGSPKLLQLSGIGDASALEELNITVVHDLPGVGMNLQAHLITPLYFKAKQPLPSNPLWIENVILGSMAGASGGSKQPEFAFLGIQRKEFLPGFPRPIACPLPECMAWLSVLLHPHSRGFVRVNSTNPRSNPVINPNYLGDERDLSMQARAIKTLRTVLASNATADWVEKELQPGTESLREHIQQRSVGAWHLVGTCRLGSQDDAWSVVDSELKLKGLNGVRVVDSSVIPALPSGSVTVTTMAIADRGAQLVLDEFNTYEALRQGHESRKEEKKGKAKPNKKGGKPKKKKAEAHQQADA